MWHEQLEIFRFHPTPNCSLLISFLICLPLGLVLAVVPLSAADSTTNAMSTVTHTETTKPNITVFHSFEGKCTAPRIANQKEGCVSKGAAQKKRKGLPVFILREYGAPLYCPDGNSSTGECERS
jgi:hypothetical protein